MATINCSTSAEISAALTSSVGGDEIVIASGTYTGLITKENLNKASTVIVRGASKTSPPVFQDQAFIFKNCSKFKLDWLVFQGVAFDTGTNGQNYPTTSEPIRLEGCDDFVLRNIRCDFYLNCLKLQKGGGINRVTIEYCTITQNCVDPIMLYGSAHDVTIDHVVVDDWQIDPNRLLGTAENRRRHPDTAHIRPNGGDVGTNPMRNLHIRALYMRDVSGRAKGLFCNNEENAVGKGFTNLLIEDSYFELGRYAAIEMTGAEDTIIRNCVVRRAFAGEGQHPLIIFEQSTSSGSVTNCVVPVNRGKDATPTSPPVGSQAVVTFRDGALANRVTLSNNQVSDTAVPTGWVALVPGVNVGVGTDPDEPGGGATKPTQMTAEWNNPPTNTVAKDGRVIPTSPVALGTTPERYAGIVVIGSLSVAWGVVNALPESPGTDVSAALGWIRTGVSTRKGMRVANPAKNAAGARRFEMIGGAGGNLDIYSVTAGLTMSDITLTYAQDGVWADYSSYSGQFTAPGTPPDPVKPTALTSGQWEFVGAVQEISPGRFVRDFKITVTHTGAKWVIDGETLQRPLAVVGTDGGANVYRLQPLDTGAENTVGYLQTRSFRAVYSTDTVFSDPSADAKSFTGPAAPPPPTPYDPGETLDRSGFLTASGFVVQIPFPNQVAAPPGEISVDLVSAAGRATVYYTGALPSDAVGLLVLYGAKVYIVRDGRARMPLKPGLTFGLLCGYDAAGQIGHARHFFVG